MSHLLQMRGLKHLRLTSPSSLDVASFTDAWIETLQSGIDKRVTESHLLQMRGLKPNVHQGTYEFTVASFTDAWIETLRKQLSLLNAEVASFTDAWIET